MRIVNIMNKIIFMITLLTIIGCGDDNPAVVPITVSFSNTSLGGADQVEAKIIFSRPVSSDGTLNISISTDLSYGEDADYYIDKDVMDNTFSIAFTSGDESSSFIIYKGSDLNINEDKTINFNLDTSNDQSIYVVGDNPTTTLTFSENFTASGGSAEINAGGNEFPNVAFFDLSKITQTSVDKNAWDLAFYSGDEFRVVLNPIVGNMAQSTGKTIITEVDADDTLGFGVTMVPTYTAPKEAVESWLDDVTGDLDDTAFGNIETANNEVFIVSNKTGGSWQKVLITQAGDNYEVQYGDIGSEVVNTVNISKSSTHNFTYFSFTNDGEVDVSPAKDKWDFYFSEKIYSYFYSYEGYEVPYGFKNFITINRNNTKVAEVMIADNTYDEFSITDASSLSYGSNIDAIGSKWRDGYAGTVYDDRFYVINDSEGNYYKLKFLKMENTAGERGYLNIEYALCE